MPVANREAMAAKAATTTRDQPRVWSAALLVLGWVLVAAIAANAVWNAARAGGMAALAREGWRAWLDALTVPPGLGIEATPLWAEGLIALFAPALLLLCVVATIRRRRHPAPNAVPLATQGQSAPTASGPSPVPSPSGAVSPTAPPPTAPPPTAPPPTAPPPTAAPMSIDAASFLNPGRRVRLAAIRAAGASTGGEPHRVAQAPASPRIFVSHSGGDNPFGHALVDRLRSAGFDAWYDSHGGPGADGTWQGGIPPATHWEDEVVRELTERDVFVVILTERAVASRWVKEEIRLAWSEKNSADVTKGKVVVPVLRETCAIPPLVALVEYVDYRPEADQERAWRVFLSAVRHGETIPAKSVIVGPPFDLGLLPPLERFVGREADVGRVLTLLTDPRAAEGQIASIAAANGLGGIGKTALATEAVRRLMALNAFPDGIGVLVCKGLTEPLDILKRALSRFTVGRREPEEDTVASLADRARGLFLGKHALVVLDNVEQGWPVARVLQALRAAGAAVLITSRAELPAVPASARVKLEVLPLSEALEVFAQNYLGGTSQEFTATQREGAIAIVESLGRHTLAVKLAAANAAALNRPLAVLARDLAEHPNKKLLLEYGEEAVGYVLGSSFDALSEEAKRVFVGLAAFAAADVGLDAVLALAESLGDEQGERSLAQVVELRMADTAFLEALPQPSDAARVRLHSLVQTYTSVLFANWPDEDQRVAHRAVFTWYADYVNEAPDLALVPDEGNVVSALERARAQGQDRVVVRICGGMAGFWRDTGRTRAGLDYLPWGIEAAERVARATDNPDDHLRAASMRSYYADVLSTTGQLDRAEDVYRRDLEIRRQFSDRRGESGALLNLGRIARLRGQWEAAEDYYQRALAIMREVGDRRGEGVALSALGEVALLLGQPAAAEDFLQQALTIDRAEGNRRGEGVVLAELGQVAEQRGQLEAAEGYFRQALDIMRELGSRRDEGAAVTALGQVALERGQPAAAEEYFQQALAVMREVGDRREEGIALTALGQVALERNQPAAAEEYFQQALAIMREVGDRQGESVDLVWLGDVAREGGRLDAAEDYYQRALAIDRARADRAREGLILMRLGRVARDRGRPDVAEEYFQQALAIMREVGDRREEGIALTALGQVALERNQPAAAEEYFQQALAIDREVGDRQGESVDLVWLGDVAREGGRLDAAEDYYQRALAIDRARADRAREGLILMRLGRVARDRGRLDVAEEYFQQGLADMRELGSRREEGVVLYALALLAEERGDLNTAERLHRESLAIGVEVRNEQDVADSLLALGRFLIEHDRGRDEGCQLLGEAARHYHEMGLPDSEERAREAARRLGCDTSIGTTDP